MARFIFDFGNFGVKWFYPRQNDYGFFLHAIAPLTEAEWRQISGRGKPPKGILRVNGLPYAVGEAARRHIVKDRPKGAARYNQLYYGPALCFALAEAFKADAKIALYASHAPQDQKYAQDLINAAKGKWEVECQYGNLTFEVQKVSPFDEPLGGFAHFTFTNRGEERLDNPVADKTVLMIDVGGYTTDRASIDPGGAIDLLSIASTRSGTIETINQFEHELREHNKQQFKGTGDLDIRRVESAIINGVYQFGNIQIDCSQEAREAKQSLVNDTIQVIESAGGAANYDAALLTGGGSVLIYEALIESFNAMNFLMVEPDRDLMKFANVFGGGKIAAIMTREGA